jgi:hypothetical protein
VDIPSLRDELKESCNTMHVLLHFTRKRCPTLADGLAAHVMQRIVSSASRRAQRVLMSTPALEMCVRVMPVLSDKSSILNAEALFMLLAALPNCSRVTELKRLFSSRENGHSFNRLCHHTLGYRGPTIILVKDHLGRVAGLYSSAQWRDTVSFQGTDESILFTLAPRFSCLRADKSRQSNGGNYLYLNSRITPQKGKRWPCGCIGGGGEPAKLTLYIDGELEHVKWTADQKCNTYVGAADVWAPPKSKISLCEVWGCGGASAQEVSLWLCARRVPSCT